jgi:hypothetical protein
MCHSTIPRCRLGLVVSGTRAGAANRRAPM